MTTITAEALNTEPTPRTGAGAGPVARSWRYVACFAAGAALSVAVAVGISAAGDDHAPARTTPASATHASTIDQCQYGKPC